MTGLQKVAAVYAAILLGAAALNYIPGVPDAGGLAFGIFALDPFDDALHLASAIWAAVAAWLGVRASRSFLLIFGALYLGDGALGLLTGWGYLDFGIFTNPSLGPSFSLLRILANLPHIGLGGVALAIGLWARPR
ncbi:hypothetical protein SAMN04488003_10690 [Loktanella fryxellensis]|uniref:DUF4383 domain-containing protein n=1 Tax=Loktanella fryxellensis TaxID=245187 RepID=A0A1H8C6Z3_9RHOB|nr:hypothetical protein [Loktanella fryxellensis]SEM90971.1 hypothetical protein SAMN04488003_10690 [Loktanella fryxellensis]